MRTTVTLDPDVERLLKEAMHRSRRSFKETLNRALRAALGPEPARSGRPAFVLTAPAGVPNAAAALGWWPLGLRGGIDPTSFNKLADELEADAFREQHTHLTGHDRP